MLGEGKQKIILKLKWSDFKIQIKYKTVSYSWYYRYVAINAKYCEINPFLKVNKSVVWLYRKRMCVFSTSIRTRTYKCRSEKTNKFVLNICCLCEGKNIEYVDIECERASQLHSRICMQRKYPSSSVNFWRTVDILQSGFFKGMKH